MRRKIHQDSLQFQIAPMVDIMFLLILFFMVSAGAIKVENELSIRLPGKVMQDQPLEMVDEQIVQVMVNGQVVLNDEQYDSPTDQELPTLVNTLKRFKELSDANKTKALVTVMSEPNAKYERVIDVLNACAAANIQGVTFTTNSEEGS